MMKNKLVIFLFLFSCGIYAQESIEVLRIKADLVSDEGQNLSDVNITINGVPYTSSSRKWTFNLLSDSVYHIEFTKKGYMGKSLVFNTYDSDDKKHFFHFDMILNKIDLEREVTYYKPMSSIVYDNYQRKFIYDKSMATKRQREIYNCKLH